jgi:thioredoxin reductase (NADPH)
MTRPVLVAVDDDGDVLAALEQALRKRYGADYQILVERSPATGLQTLERLRQQDLAVAVIIADQWMPQVTGLELLARARQLHPAARRLLLIGVWDRTANQPMSQAMTLGRLDGWVLKPWEPAEEHLYLPVTQQLSEWLRATGQPGFVAIQIVGEQWTPRSHQIRDLLERNAIPYKFHPTTARPAGSCCGRPGRTVAACRCWCCSTGGCWSTPPTPRAPPPSVSQPGPSQAATI